VALDADRRARRELDLPIEETELDIDDLLFEERKERTLRVLDARGRPARVSVEVCDELSLWYSPEFANTGTDAQGYFRWKSLREGASIRISAPYAPSDLVPLCTTLRGEGPFEVRLGSATIEVDVRGLEDASLVLDGSAFCDPGDDDRFVLRGVTAGPHDLLVGAHGRIGKAYRLVLKDGETRRLAPDLRPR
jgi:hypothetical protein